MKLKNLFKNLLLLAVTLIVFFLLLDVGVRIFASASRGLFQFNEILGPWRGTNVEFQEKTKEFGLISQQTNSLGFVDLEHELKKDKDTYRILILGDSWVEAIQVPLEKKFTRILEGKLNELPGDKKFEVITMGVSSFATDQEYLTLKEYGLKYDPDLVILMFFPANDIFYSSLSLSNEYSKPYFKINNGELEKVREPQSVEQNRIVSFITRNFQAPRFIYKKIKLLQDRIASSKIKAEAAYSLRQLEVYKKSYDDDWEQAWELVKVLIKKMDEEVKGQGGKFLVTYVPYTGEIYPDLWNELLDESSLMEEGEWDLGKAAEITKEFCLEEEIKYFDLSGPIRDFLRKTKAEIYGDHFNSRGQELVTEAMHDFLIDNDLIYNSTSTSDSYDENLAD